MNNPMSNLKQVKDGSVTASRNKALFEAIKMRSINTVKLLLTSGSSVNTVDDNGDTPLHLAVQTSCFEITKMLLDSGANVNAKNESNFTPIRLTVKLKNAKMTQLLINAGADLSAKDDLGYTPLHVAVEMKNLNIIDLLLKAGADANAGDNDGHTPIHEAVLSKDLNSLKLMLDSGADPNRPNKSMVTPLHFAQNSATVKMLLDSGADVNAKEVNGNTPLHTAARDLSFFNVLKLLVYGGGNVNELNREGDTCFSILHTNPYFNQSSESVCYNPAPFFFVKFSQNRNKEDQLEELVRLHLIECVDVNLTNKDGKNILAKILQLDFVLLKKKKELINKKIFSKLILEYVAKVMASNICVDLNLIETITCMNVCNDYFQKCLKELEKMKYKRLNQCDVSFFKLLVDDENKLLEYGCNKEFLKDFKKSDVEKKFPIYGRIIKRNMYNAIESCKSLNEAASNLLHQIPVFEDVLLTQVIRDILSTLSKENYDLLNKKKRHFQ